MGQGRYTIQKWNLKDCSKRLNLIIFWVEIVIKYRRKFSSCKWICAKNQAWKGNNGFGMVMISFRWRDLNSFSFSIVKFYCLWVGVRKSLVYQMLFATNIDRAKISNVVGAIVSLYKFSFFISYICLITWNVLFRLLCTNSFHSCV